MSCRLQSQPRQKVRARSVHLHRMSVCTTRVPDYDLLFSTSAFSKVELTSCCIAAAAVFDTTAVLLLYRRKQT